MLVCAVTSTDQPDAASTPAIKNMKATYDMFIRALTFLGMFATLMFLLGYTYASIPIAMSKTCTPSFIDRIFK